MTVCKYKTMFLVYMSLRLCYTSLSLLLLLLLHDLFFIVFVQFILVILSAIYVAIACDNIMLSY